MAIIIKNFRITRFVTIIGTFIIFILLMSTFIVTTLENTKTYYLNQWFNDISTDDFIFIFQQENHYFNSSSTTKDSEESILYFTFSLLTNIHFNDMRSFIRNEIPGYANYYSKILVSGEGTDLTNIPTEPNVSKENLVKDPVINEEEIKKHETTTTSSIPEEKVVFIYHSHSRESFFSILPESNKNNPDTASSPKANITLLGERLKSKLEENGIGAIDDHTDISQMLLDKDLTYGSSYKMSREIIQDTLGNEPNIEYLIDLHRDSARREITTKSINGQNFARLYFVVGMENKNKESNIKLATEINSALESKYPGISRGIFPKYYKDGNGVYNQDLSANSMLIEIGGVDNTLDELYRTVDALAEVLTDYYQNENKKNSHSPS